MPPRHPHTPHLSVATARLGQPSLSVRVELRDGSYHAGADGRCSCKIRKASSQICPTSPLPQSLLLAVHRHIVFIFIYWFSFGTQWCYGFLIVDFFFLSLLLLCVCVCVCACTCWECTRCIWIIIFIFNQATGWVNLWTSLGNHAPCVIFVL